MKKLTNEKAYQTTFRKRHIFAKELGLTDREYRIWDLYTTVYDWDSRHTETFGTIETTDAQVASLIGCDPSTVSRTRNILIQKGLIKQLENGLIQILVVAEKPNATHQHAYAPHQYGYAPQNSYLADTQQNQGYSQESPLVASKEDLGSSKEKGGTPVNVIPNVFGGFEEENSPDWEKLNELRNRKDELRQQIAGRWSSPDPTMRDLIDEHNRISGQINEIE